MPRGTAKKQSTRRNQRATSTNSENAIALLKADHRKLEELFEQYRDAETFEEKQWTAHQVCKDLIIHGRLEEEIFYPACREAGIDDEMLNEAQVEHDGIETLLAELIRTSPDDRFYDAKVKVLSNYVEHHFGEEERPKAGIFAKAQKAEIDESDLGRQIEDRRQQLVAGTDEDLGPPEHYRRPRLAHYLDRREHGRFVSDDDYRGREYASRGRHGERGEEGRFVGEGSRGRYSRGRDYDEEDDNRHRGHRGQGGWFGDPEGHSEASEGGREDRSRGDYSSRSREHDEDSDYRGRRGHGGWYGDPERHAEASEHGWEHGSRGGYSSRGQDYEDEEDYRSRSSQGRRREHGGRFGNSEGHSEASRRRRDER